MNKLWHLKTQRRLLSSSAASDVATDNLKDDEKLAGRRTELFFLRSIGERNYGGLEVFQGKKTSSSWVFRLEKAEDAFVAGCSSRTPVKETLSLGCVIVFNHTKQTSDIHNFCTFSGPFLKQLNNQLWLLKCPENMDNHVHIVPGSCPLQSRFSPLGTAVNCLHFSFTDFSSSTQRQLSSSSVCSQCECRSLLICRIEI